MKIFRINLPSSMPRTAPVRIRTLFDPWRLLAGLALLASAAIAGAVAYFTWRNLMTVWALLEEWRMYGVW